MKTRHLKPCSNVTVAQFLCNFQLQPLCCFLNALASLCRKVGASEVVVTIVEAFVKLGLFMGYMILISRMKDIQRTFMYHGAEHKCINCVENGKPLTVENVLESSRFHRRLRNKLSVPGYDSKYFPTFYFCTGTVLLVPSFRPSAHGTCSIWNFI